MSSPSASNKPLFRPEAVAAQTSQFLGGIRIATAPSLTLVPGVALPAGGPIPASSAQGARVLAIHVREDDIVEAGQALASLELGGYSGANQGSNAELITPCNFMRGPASI